MLLQKVRWNLFQANQKDTLEVQESLGTRRKHKVIGNFKKIINLKNIALSIF